MTNLISTEEQQALKTQFSSLICLPKPVFNQLAFKTPDTTSFDLQDPEAICAASYFGPMLYPATYEDFLKGHKKISDDLLTQEISQLKEESKILKNELFCFGIKVTNAIGSTDNQVSASLLHQHPGVQAYNQLQLKIKELKILLKKGSSARKLRLAKDFGFKSLPEVKEFYIKLNTCAKKTKQGTSKFIHLCRSEQYINYRLRGGAKISADAISVLKQHPAYVIDAYLDIKSGKYPNLYLEEFKSALLLMEAIDNKVKVHPLIYTCYTNKLTLDSKPMRVSLITDQDKDNVISLAQETFNLNEIDLKDFMIQVGK